VGELFRRLGQFGADVSYAPEGRGCVARFVCFRLESHDWT
jgi:hypothetical protein